MRKQLLWVISKIKISKLAQSESNAQNIERPNQVEAYDKAIQVLFIDLKQPESEYESKQDSEDSENQDNIDETGLNSKHQHKKKKFLANLISGGLTTFAKPFQFHVKKEEKQVSHPVEKLIYGFIKSYNKKKGNFSRIKAFPVKMLLKIISEVYEKSKVFTFRIILITNFKPF